MSSGLALLFDDIAALAKLAAVSIDDVAAQAGKSISNAAGIVIDDAAATPQYVTGMSPARELPMIFKIGVGSLLNKAILTTGLMGLSYGLSYTSVPVLSIVTPVLMLGGTYLAYEGYEKFFGGHHTPATEQKELHQLVEASKTEKLEPIERERIKGAIKTDFILSAEIMAMTFGSVANNSMPNQAMVLAATGLAMTLGVYGFVGILVKADDMGLGMTRYKSDAPLARPVHSIGRGIVKSMAPIFNGLSIVGAAAMLWVGGGMLIHGAAHFGVTAPEHLLHDISHAVSDAAPFLKGVFGWVAGAAASAVLGLAAGAATDKVVKAARKGLTLHS